MPDIRFAHQVVYDVPESSAISDVIESLQATEQLFFEVAPLLEQLVPGIQVGGVRVHVQSLTQGSPLRELFFTTMFLTFQRDLEREVPAVVEHLTGAHVSGQYDTLVTFIFCAILFYGAEFAYKQIAKTIDGSRIQAHLDNLIKDVADHCNLPEARVRQLFDKRYEKKRLGPLMRSTVQFFAPSKQQGNAPFSIGKRRFDADTVAEFPGDAKIQDYEDGESNRNLENVEIELHAQDVDHARQGWAGVIRQVSDRRLRMAVYPPIKPDDIYTKTKVRGDVIVVSRRAPDGSMEPFMFHLIRLR